MRRLVKSRPTTMNLSGSSGETMIETLVSILISALALLLMATAIGSSVKVVSRSKDYTGMYYQRENALTGGGASGYDSSLVTSVPLELSRGASNSIPITIYKDDDTGIAYYERKE